MVLLDEKHVIILDSFVGFCIVISENHPDNFF